MGIQAQGHTFCVTIISKTTGMTVLTCGNFHDEGRAIAAVRRINRALGRHKPGYEARLTSRWNDTSNEFVLSVLIRGGGQIPE